jgi:hypothetical protein
MPGMRVSLEGLIANAGGALRCSRDNGGRMYAYCLEELHKHIKGVVNGEHSLEEFAEFYCIKKDAPAPEPETAK